jgi:multidrug resistance efflux pump
MPVIAGAALLRLRNLPLESKVAAANADYAVASKRVISASLHYANLGPAVEEWNQLAQQTRQLQSQAGNLELAAPISGIVLSPRLSDRLGAFIPEGTELIEIGDLREMRARIYVSEHDLYKIRIGAPTRLLVEGIAARRYAQASAIAPASFELEPGLAGSNKYQGLHPPRFYLVDALILNSDGSLKPGMVGNAMIYGQRRSLAGLLGREIQRFFARKAW